MSESKRRNSEKALSERVISRESQSTYGGSISDIEDAQDSSSLKSNKYRKMAKKLAQDKARLKDKLRRLIDETEIRAKDHHSELENNQEYFQEQLTEITDERDKLYDDLGKTRASLLEEKDNYRRQYEDKLVKYKETLEKRYGTKDSNVVKRLENTISTLQERLNKKTDETETVKDTTEQYYTQREEQFRKNIVDLEEQCQKAKDIANKEHRDLQMLIKSYNNEKEQLSVNIKREKDVEITQILNEKNNIIIALQGIKEQLEKRVKNSEKDRDDKLASVNFELEKISSTYEKKFIETNQNYSKKMDELKHEYESQIQEQTRISQKDLGIKEKDFEKKINNIITDSARKIESQEIHYKAELNRLKTENLRLSSDLGIIRQNLEKEYSIKEDSVRKNYENIIEKNNAQYNSILSERNTDLNKQKEKYEENIRDLNNTVSQLNHHLSQSKENLKNIQLTLECNNSKLVVDLAKQKENFEKTLGDRDQTILELKRNLTNMGMESVDKFNSLERKVNSVSEELKETSSKLAVSRINEENSENLVKSLKAELIRIQKSTSSTSEQLKTLQLEKEVLERRIVFSDTENGNKELFFVKLKNELAKMVQNEIGLKEENNRLSKNLEKTRIDLEQSSRSLGNSITTINNLKEEFNQMKAGLLEDHRQRISNLHNDKDKLTADLQKELLSLRNSIGGYMKDIDNKNRENMGLKNDLKTLEVKEAQITMLNNQITNIQHNYKNTLDMITADHKKDKEELNLLNKKIKDQTEIEQENTKLRIQTNTIIESCKTSIYKLEDVHKREMDKYNSKNKDLEEKITQGEQLIDAMKGECNRKIREFKNDSEHRHQKELMGITEVLRETESKYVKSESMLTMLKLEFNNKVSELRQLGPDDRQKLVDLEKERDTLLAQLKMTEHRLNAIQIEFASISANISAKDKVLGDKEKELKEEAIRLRNEPPKLLDPQFKKDRNNALAQLRQNKLDNIKMKEQLLELTSKLQIAESLIKDLNREKNLMLETHNEIKATFVNNLNHQQANHQGDLEKRDNRIRDLEKILTDKIT